MSISEAVIAWRNELDAVIACREFLENSFPDACSEGRISDFLAIAAKEHGENRIKLVLSHTIRSLPDPFSIPPEVRSWAAKQPTYRLPPSKRKGPSRFRELEMKVTSEALTAAVYEIIRHERVRAVKREVSR